MGFDLSNSAGATDQWTSMYWRTMLDTARHYGWAAPGTLPPENTNPAQWGGHYMTNDGQLVTAEDAASLAHHLRLAADAPDVERVFNGIYAAYIADANREVERILALAAPPPGLFTRLRAAILGNRPVQEPEVTRAAPEAPHIPLANVVGPLRKLAAFCEQGSFRIR
ncbi:MAG TPA: hypothetical protein PKW90_20700 [Myxococcota bacterium]|nr:hypothetical protein [Myxococcota bacterium]